MRPFTFPAMKSALLIGTLVFSLSLSAEEKPKLHSATKPVPRAGGWMNRHKSFNTRVAKGKVDLVFIGDSITQAWENPGGKVWAKFYGKRNAVNLGISGDRTQHVIWRLDNGNLYNIQPKAAVIMIGTNNSGSNTSQEIADGLKIIVKQIRTKSPKTKILLLGVFPRGTNNADKRRQVNEGANAIFSKLDDGKHVHLSEKGYSIWAESIESELAKLLGE
jgi:lysophospholipase L1-like esterase